MTDLSPEQVASWRLGFTRELWYRFTPAVSKGYHIRVEAGYNSAVGIYSACGAAPIHCNINCQGLMGYSLVEVLLDAQTAYYIAVGGYEDDTGAFTLTVGGIQYINCALVRGPASGTPGRCRKVFKQIDNAWRLLTQFAKSARKQQLLLDCHGPMPSSDNPGERIPRFRRHNHRKLVKFDSLHRSAV